jgi:2-oxoglutarate dehydrogenase E1 component
MLRTSLRQKSSQLLKAGCSARSICTTPRTPLSFSNSCKSSLASKRSSLPGLSQKRYAAAVASAPDPNDSFLSGNTANYIDEMYMEWKQDPKSVHVSWQVYFKNMESGDMPMSQAFTPPPTLVPSPTGGVASFMPGLGMSAGQGSDVTNHLKVQLLVRAYQARGHHKAKIDPLGIRIEAEQFGYSNPKELRLEHYQFTEKDLDTEYTLGPGILPRFKKEGREKMTLRDIIAACERIYCGSYGVEYIHIPDRQQCSTD